MHREIQNTQEDPNYTGRSRIHREIQNTQGDPECTERSRIHREIQNTQGDPECREILNTEDLGKCNKIQNQKIQSNSRKSRIHEVQNQEI